MTAYDQEQRRWLRCHKRWADRMTIIWQTIIIVTFVGLYWLLTYARATPESLSLAMLLLVAVELVAAIWQAVSLAVYRVHLITAGVDLQQE